MPRLLLRAAASLLLGISAATPRPAYAQIDTIARFGGLDDAGGLVSFQPYAAAFMGDDVVLSQGDGLYLLSADGSARQFSARGEGPGDVQFVRELAVFGDSILAFDIVQRRLTIFVGGSREISTSSFPDVAAYHEASPLSDGSIVTFYLPDLERLVRSPGYRGAGAVVRPDSLFVRRRAPGGDPTLIGVFQMSPRYQTSAGTFFAPGHERLLRWVDGDHLLVAGSHASTFVVLDLFTGERRNGSTSLEPRPFDPRLHGLLVDEFVSQEQTGLGFGSPRPATEARRAVVAAAGRPRLAPLFDRAVLAQSGEVWLREVDEPGGSIDTWRVVSTATSERVVRLPSDLVIRAIRADRIVATSRDEFDVSTVFLFSVPQ